eukprot:scaffold27464_cov107-Isochrysis_galbana.AAC.1
MRRMNPSAGEWRRRNGPKKTKGEDGRPGSGGECTARTFGHTHSSPLVWWSGCSTTKRTRATAGRSGGGRSWTPSPRCRACAAAAAPRAGARC